jgi:hypothetical protein
MSNAHTKKKSGSACWAVRRRVPIGYHAVQLDQNLELFKIFWNPSIFSESKHV